MTSQWAREESTGASIGDSRLDARLASVLSDLGNRPQLSIPTACGSHSETQAAYRFFDNRKVTFAKVLAPHRQQTLKRMAAQTHVLLVQDSTEIDLTRPRQQVTGAGKLNGSRRGILLHVLHAFTVGGIPLGTLWATHVNSTQPVAVKETPAQRRKRMRDTPIEDKQSMRWLTGLRHARDAALSLPKVQCICVGDSEADIYELFAEPRGNAAVAQVHWLIRACRDRALNTQAPPLRDGGSPGDRLQEQADHLREQLLCAAVLYEQDVTIRHREALTAVEKRRRRASRPARKVHLQVQAARVTLRPPWRQDRKLPPVTVNAVLVREHKAPIGQEAIEWVLVTTLPIDSIEQVRKIVQYYCVRWNIEILFRTLKSGCRVESRRFEKLTRIKRCLGLYLIVAWRTLFVCHCARDDPQRDCQTVFEPNEWQAVWAATQQTMPPRKHPTLGKIVSLVAQLGGYIERSNSPPGPQSIWIGLTRLYDLTSAWTIFGPHAKLAKR
jgi:Transposase DNA-binding/Transposase Tn5 dimerisation domain